MLNRLKTKEKRKCAMLSEMIGILNDWLYTYILVILLIAAGVYFTVRSGFVQFRMFAESIRVVGEKPHEAGTVSSFQALMVSTASRVGTGNIIGISTAICCGGYGAVFWMWVIAIIGGASAFVESTLAQIYKRRNPKTGESYGGPSYYIEAALHSRVLAVIFAVTLILTYAGGFNMLAAYNLQSTFSGYSFYDPATTPWVIGAVLAAVVGYCVMGGGKRIIRFTSTLVPFMGGLYVLVAVVMVVLNWRMVPQVLGSIFAGAFDFQAIFGGFTGSAMMYGIKRGLFSNEAGVGSAPNAAASADVSHPVKQGLVQMLSVFIDTLLICSATAFMLLCSGVAPEASLQGAPYVQMALQAQFGAAGPIFITAAMVLFAFTTLIGNLYYVDNCLNYIVGKIPAKEFMVLFRIDAVVLIFIGAGMEINMVWNLADVLMGVMALINLPVIVILARPALAALRDYTRQRKEGKNPVFRAADVGLAGKTECWE
jgi:AGCS family alanine or glycine:cation symporter